MSGGFSFRFALVLTSKSARTQRLCWALSAERSLWLTSSLTGEKVAQYESRWVDEEESQYQW